ncbi:trypsin-like serine protease, partial [Solihabitans fulvus]
VQPACIWSGEESTSKVGTIAGWGYDVTGKHHKELTTIEMIEVDQNSCLRSHDPSYSAYISDKIYCAKHVNGTSNCHKDSGGGMMVRVKNKWYLRGVLSFYYSPELQHACQSHALFTDVAKHLPWIKQHVYDYV